MTQLSILIPLTLSRKEIFKPLHKSLLRQSVGKPVQILLDWDEKDNVGVKRNRLLSAAKGAWSVFVDSDDMVAEDYVDRILKALESDPDCVGISGWITTNGYRARAWHISLAYGRWYVHKGVYYRTPNHISPVRTSIALQAGFPEIAYGEDYVYSMRLLPLLKTEVVVEGDIYHYRFVPKKK